MPVGAVCNMNVAVRPVGVGDMVDLHAGRKHVDDDSIIERHYARAEFFASYKLTLRRIHRKKVTFHADKIAFMPFYSADKMTSCVTLEELSMNDVNVFANINDHKLIDLCFALPNLCLAFPCGCPRFRFFETAPIKSSIKLSDKNGEIDMNLARQRPKTAHVADQTKH
jgi:hypothetical protein